jgi:3'(2'), 5'-bisphosphate nucleotidase
MRECLTSALLAAREAGEEILGVYRGEIDVTYKEDASPLTLADKRAHAIILNRLSTKALKPMPLLSEEGKHTPYEERKAWKYFWLVDPLDGTKEFVQRRGEFTVNIALICKNRPVLGVVFVPVRGFLYFAAEGFGAYKLNNDEAVWKSLDMEEHAGKGNELMEHIVDSAKRLPLHHPDNGSGERLTIVGSRSHGSDALASFVGTTKQKFREVEFIPAGSALKFGLIAEGIAHIYPRLGPTMEWDTAAGQCVVEQSGGMVLRLQEKTPLDYNKKDLRNPKFFCTGKHCKHLHELFHLV